MGATHGDGRELPGHILAGGQGLEPGNGDLVDVDDGGEPGFRQRHVVLEAEVDRTRPKRQRQEFAEVFVDGGGRYPRDVQAAARGRGGDGEGALEIELRAGVRTRHQPEHVAGTLGAEVVETKADGREGGGEGLATGAVGVVEPTPGDFETADAQPRQSGLGGLGLRLRHTVGPGEELHHIEAAIGTLYEPSVGFVQLDATESPGTVPQRGQLEVDVQAAETEHRLAVVAIDAKATGLELEGERIEAHAVEACRGGVLAGEDIHDTLPDEARHAEEPGKSVEGEHRRRDGGSDERGPAGHGVSR